MVGETSRETHPHHTRNERIRFHKISTVAIMDSAPAFGLRIDPPKVLRMFPMASRSPSVSYRLETTHTAGHGNLTWSSDTWNCCTESSYDKRDLLQLPEVEPIFMKSQPLLVDLDLSVENVLGLPFMGCHRNSAKRLTKTLYERAWKLCRYV